MHTSVQTLTAKAPQRHIARVHIRWMIRRDMPEVLEIEGSEFTHPWSESDFVRCLRQRNCIGMVAEHDDRVAGFMIYELHKTRVELLNLAVAGGMQLRGVGRQLIDKLKSKLSTTRRTRITADVSETNLDAHLFLRKMGFRAVAVVPGLWPQDGDPDAYHFLYRVKGGRP